LSPRPSVSRDAKKYNSRIETHYSKTKQKTENLIFFKKK